MLVEVLKDQDKTGAFVALFNGSVGARLRLKRAVQHSDANERFVFSRWECR